jgi:transposase
MNRARFEGRFENSLPNGVPDGGTVIMGRPSFHRTKQLGEIRTKAEVNLLLLPVYAPDFNPAGKDWANMRRALRDTAPLCGLFQTAVYDYWRSVFFRRIIVLLPKKGQFKICG